MTLPDLVRSFVRDELLHSGADPDEERLFQAYAAETTGWIVRAMAIALIVSGFVWSIGDAWLLVEAPEARKVGQHWRIGNFLAMLPVVILPDSIPRLRRNPIPLDALCMALACVWATWSTGRLPPDAAWYGVLYLLPTISTMLLVPIVPRILFATAFGVVAWVGYYGLHPDRLAEADKLGLVFSLQALSIFLAVGIGHLVYHHIRLSFRARKALSEANAELEKRVREQRADLRRLANNIETVREEERVDLARELHDELGQVLTALRFEVALLESEARRQGGVIDVKDVDFYLDRMRSSFRRILQRLRPRILDDFGLVAATEWLVKDLATETGLDISLVVEPQGLAVQGVHRVIAFRALRESLSNTARHASARSVSVELRAEPDALTLSVTDDGSGIAPRTDWPDEAIGIIGTRERARTIGGDFVVRRLEGGGTLAQLRIPLSDSLEPA